MKLKVCGMKYKDNIEAVAGLNPDYMGFIFYEKSPRFVSDALPKISEHIQKVGVFVNSSSENIKKQIQNYDLQAVQLHGQETPEFCKTIRNEGIEVIKVFSVKTYFDFNLLSKYEAVVDYFLFDTKGPNPGGNGDHFDWSILNQYNSTIPYFLSGGIGLDNIDSLKKFMRSNAAKQCYAIDVNSKFETQPALKDDVQLKKFIDQL